jgi:alpha-L-fucosidase
VYVLRLVSPPPPLPRHPQKSEWYQQRLLTGDDGGFVQDFHKNNYPPDFTYADFASMFKVCGGGL